MARERRPEPWPSTPASPRPSPPRAGGDRRGRRRHDSALFAFCVAPADRGVGVIRGDRSKVARHVGGTLTEGG